MYRWPACLCACFAGAIAQPADNAEPVCSVGEGCSGGSTTPENPYFWPSARGHAHAYSTSKHAIPLDLKKAHSWTWYHPGGQYHTISLGCVIDDERNIYLATHDAIWKISPDGLAIWNYAPPNTAIPTVPSLQDGALFGSVHSGHIFAVNMTTGKELWSTKVAKEIAGDTGFVTVHGGIVVAGADSTNGERNAAVCGVNASDGQEVWCFRPQVPVWNFMALFPDDGTFVFQDLEGRAYRCRLGSGELIWKAGGLPGTWTDGTQMLGPNGMVYAVTTNGGLVPCAFRRVCAGFLTAYRLDDGEVLWNRSMHLPPNVFPAVGRLSEGGGLSVVQPVGQQAGIPRDFIIPRLNYAAPFFGVILAVPLGVARLACSLRCKRGSCRRRRYVAAWSCFGFALGVATLLVIPRIFYRRPFTYHADILALDAQTGHEQWRYSLPPWISFHTAGDPEGLETRLSVGTRFICIPNPFSAPTIGPDGAVYIGFQDGRLYSLRDINSDGHIDTETEVFTFETGTAFSSPGAAFAPGMLAVANCDGLFVFKQ